MGEKKPVDVICSREGKDFPVPHEKKVTESEALEKRMETMEKTLSEMRDQMRLISHLLAGLLPPDMPKEGAASAKKAGSVSRHRRAKAQSNNPSLSIDTWLIDRDERGGDHDD